MIAQQGEEKGLFTFYFEENQKQQIKENQKQLANLQKQRKKNKSKKKKKLSQKQSQVFKTEPSQDKSTSLQMSPTDAFLAKVVYKKLKAYPKNLSATEQNSEKVLQSKSSISHKLLNTVEESKKIKKLYTEGNEDENLEQEFLKLRKNQKVRYNFYSKSKTQGRQNYSQHKTGDFKLPQIKSTKLTKAYDKLFQQEQIRQSAGKHEIYQSQKSKKVLKQVIKKQMEKKKFQGQHLATIELSCMDYQNGPEWPQQKRLLMKKIGRKF